MFDLISFDQLTAAWGPQISIILRFCSAFALLHFIVLRPLYNFFLHPLREYPGPRLWAASVLPWACMFLSGQSHRRLRELHDRYGRTVRLGPNELSFTVPEAWNDIMGRSKPGIRQENPKAPWYLSPSSKDIIGALHDDHTRMRRLMAGGFSTAAMQQQQQIIKSYVDLLIGRLHISAAQDDLIDIHAWYNYCTFDIIGDLTFGESFGCLDEAAMHPWISLIFANIRLTAFILVFKRIPVLLALLPFFVSYKLVKQFREHQQISREKVAKRLEFKDSRADFVQDMITGKAGQVECLRGMQTMSRDELVNNSVILTLAGSETTATSLAGATYLIMKDRRVERRILEELRSRFSEAEDMDLMNVATLPYLGAVTEECLRLYPPGPNAQPRITPPKGNTILGKYIPGNTILGIPHRAMYLSESNFTRPTEFIPERWLDPTRSEEFAGDRRECFHPFSYGPRNCIGMNLAYAELRLILARVIWDFEMEISASSEGWMENQDSYLLWQKQPLWVRLVPRKGDSESVRESAPYSSRDRL
ncbi:hypothetical protein M409DRAFT_38012 [Zasmidium cellare ATCC 36951]|uniref:Cytochrome P450 monooxygenase n=1 Tax=Zasmidium cellare ATCC 36951 TaxID=1080233 RepID=A0A6A6BZV4_ZASCE|nr:uncharacterized protein M409DRAFT_38012 [Zasmidium cellare ATCC 36951]KAF2158976.1 hypothetical protein M409DRAFT_38012 [Zasmidium cellare ATCC 36951]